MSELERYWDGDRDAVRESLRLARERGQLVSWRQVPAAPGQVAVLAVLRTPDPPQRVGRPGWSRGAVAAGAGLGVAACALAGAAAAVLWWVAVWVLDHAAQIAGVTVTAGAVLGVGWWLLGRAGACPGIHCPGCSCR